MQFEMQRWKISPLLTTTDYRYLRNIFI